MTNDVKHSIVNAMLDALDNKLGEASKEKRSEAYFEMCEELEKSNINNNSYFIGALIQILGI